MDCSSEEDESHGQLDGMLEESYFGIREINENKKTVADEFLLIVTMAIRVVNRYDNTVIRHSNPSIKQHSTTTQRLRHYKS